MAEPRRRSARIRNQKQAQDSKTANNEPGTNGRKGHAQQPSPTHSRKRAAEGSVQHSRKHRNTAHPPDPVLTDPKAVKPEKTRKGYAIQHWVEEGVWPVALAQPTAMDQVDANRRAREKSTTPTHTPYNSKTTGNKTHGYSDSRCWVHLRACGVFLSTHDDEPLPDDVMLSQRLLDDIFETPRDTAFDDHTFRYTCKRLAMRNETAVMQIIHRLIVPSAEIAAHRRQLTFEHLVESINERWTGSNSLVRPSLQLPNRKGRRYRLPTPQPDYAVGFSESAFTTAQIRKLQPHIGEREDTSHFKGTSDMLFPFLVAEAKASIGSLESADRANAHSSAIAMRGIVELFRLVNREKELHRKILAFSISHDHRFVTIEAHYPVILADKVEYYRYTIDEFGIMPRNGEKRWTAYNFVMGIYNTWVPAHFKLLSSAVDDLPEIDFDTISSPPTPQHQTASATSPADRASSEPEGSASSSSENQPPRKLRGRKEPQGKRKR
ncbi:uncharacterized protein BJX67DRAFT_348665 [Aspergillus lucknowensis]|uniref:DUF7924 domain-containing protein n=1 Tax=Aspergillus lucknowensis TaxID=176173 RepID=A0ABR4M0F3_9EURO